MSYGHGSSRRPPAYGGTRKMDIPVPDERRYPPQRRSDDPRRGDPRYAGDPRYQGDPRHRGDPRYRGGPPPQRDGYGAPPMRPRRRKRRAGRVFLIILLAIVLLLAGVWLWVDLSLNRVQALTDYQGRPAEGAGTNWLIVGSDSRAELSAEDEERLATGDVKGKRTDTMMLLHIPDNDTKPTLVSLLRDSRVDIPGKGRNKLNAAYAFGGAKLLAQTVEMNTGLRLDHYMEIGFGGFESIVDAVDGVEMCLREPIKDDLAGIDLPAGCQTLNGAQALGYVRTRATPRADLDRVIHQREFIGALTDKVTSPGTLLNPFDVIPLLADAPDAITVDEGDHLHHLPSLAFAIAGASNGDTVTTTVPMGGSSGGAIIWHETKAPKLFDALRTDQPVPQDALVDVP